MCFVTFNVLEESGNNPWTVQHGLQRACVLSRRRDEDEEVSEESEYEVSDRSERGDTPDGDGNDSLDYSHDRRRDEDLSAAEEDEEEEDGVLTHRVHVSFPDGRSCSLTGSTGLMGEPRHAV